ncbi:MAG: YicC family protein [Bacteroidetes bacterium]|nr:MAG: YicC family protein [Bacteroidota bacterium]
MTGFGALQIESEQFTLNIEIKSINSKFMDLYLRLPNHFSDKELAVRNMISKVLVRGKVATFITYSNKQELLNKINFNHEVIEHYYQTLKQTADKLGANTNNLFSSVLALPNVYTSLGNVSDEQEWSFVENAIEKVILECDQARIEEGKALQTMLEDCIAKISEALAKIEELDPLRMIRQRERLQKQVNDLLNSESFDQNRFEQELIYYSERFDIHEEKIRLKTHLPYFLNTIAEKESNGKKLNFISQEIGREINTIGSKANDAQIQQLVVSMKEELEKIKEQLSNIL